MLLSIITVNYNDADGLEKTIKSVHSQTFGDFEHIIIDGDSHDGSKEVITKHKDSFRYWVSEPDDGVYQAMNKGIKKATGKYLFFLNSGDELHDPEVLVEVAKFLKGEKDIYYGNLNLVDGSEVKKTYFPPNVLTFEYFLKRTIPHQAAFIKKELFTTISYYNEKYRIVSDWEFFMIAIFKKDASYEFIPRIISNYDTNGISSNIENTELFRKERQTSLLTNFPFFIKDYEELRINRIILKSNRFRMLQELEKSFIAKKMNSLWLRIILLICRGKRLKQLKNE